MFSLTPTWMQMLKTRVGENAYKCDIYGAGWVVLDMVNRSQFRGASYLCEIRPGPTIQHNMVLVCNAGFIPPRLQRERSGSRYMANLGGQVLGPNNERNRACCRRLTPVQ
ncbi:unnamed protein product, partial [Mesorhabditis spiculigera]